MEFKFDWWTWWGLVAQGLFFSRFLVQWYFSEKAGKTVIPTLFWYLSLIGSLMVLIYAFFRHDLVFLITGVLQIFLYTRNLVISKNGKNK